MPISWLAVLQSVPWSDVIANAPKVAEGARKLWNAVGKKSDSNEPAADDAAGTQLAALPTTDELAARIDALETEVSDLQEQMLASSELIKALAEQNAQLVARVELNRLRTLRLVGAVAVIAGLAALGVVLALARGAA